MASATVLSPSDKLLQALSSPVINTAVRHATIKLLGEHKNVDFRKLSVLKWSVDGAESMIAQMQCPPDPPKPVVIPGEAINRFVSRIVSKKTKERVPDQTRNDDRDRYIELLAKGDVLASSLWALRLKLMPLYLIGGDFVMNPWDFVTGRKTPSGKFNGASPSEDHSGDA